MSIKSLFERPFRLRLTMGLMAVALVACGSLPPKAPLPPPNPRPAIHDTAFARMAKASLTPGHPSGFRLLPQASHAFEARMQLIARAERTLDVQYYFIANDVSGRAFLLALGEAAGRGVQVRLLVDDLHTAEIEPMLRSVSGQPNMDVRLFNPFCCARSGLVSRFVASLADWRRLNHRMHNKLMIADGSLALAGGRNVADEYFAGSAQHEFVDVDVLMAGEIVNQLTTIFMSYWDSDPVWPAKAILDRVPSADGHAPASFPRSADAPHPPDADGEDVLGQDAPGAAFEKGLLTLIPGAAYAFADSPSKVLLDDEDYLHTSSAISRLRETFAHAQSEVVVSTPYLIPREKGMELIGQLVANGVKIVVLTNSMAANDSIFAHSGYARYRRRMLLAGVELYELSPARASAPKRPASGMRAARSFGRLHTKAAVIDRSSLYIGSVNIDPRSAEKNTEVGVWIESATLARQMLDVLEANRRLGAYRVMLGPDSRGLRWVTVDDHGNESVFLTEPESTLFMRLKERLIAPLVPESLL